jgi:NAD(P)-dependent dehydrogenase (short-subunit alcohol dehydrogenase family)
MAEAKRCLVLGGSGYVGGDVCRLLIERGARVAFTYWRHEVSHAGALGLRVDLRDFAATEDVVEQAAERLGGLDALVQCAGTAGDPALYKGGGLDKLQAISEAGWDEMLDVTAKSSFAACRAAARLMAARGGQMVLVGSMDGVKTVPAPIHYAAGKGALRAMVQALAKELGPRNILINMVAPGILDGGLAKLLSDELLQEYLKHSSLKRTGSAREIAELVAWLALENSYLSGQAIVLDGGL